MAISLGREDIDYQNQLANTNAFEQLNRLLQPQKYSKNVILMAIKVLGILCVGQYNVLQSDGYAHEQHSWCNG